MNFYFYHWSTNPFSTCIPFHFLCNGQVPASNLDQFQSFVQMTSSSYLIYSNQQNFRYCTFLAQSILFSSTTFPHHIISCSICDLFRMSFPCCVFCSSRIMKVECTHLGRACLATKALSVLVKTFGRCRIQVSSSCQSLSY